MEIRNVKEWSTALNENAKLMKDYEDKLSQFYKFNHMVQDFSTPFLASCYKKISFKQNISKFITSSWKLYLILLSVVSLGMWIFFIFSHSEESIGNAFSNYASSSIVPAILIGLGTALVIKAISIYFTYLSYKSKIKKLDALEKSLTNFIITVPASYRTSEKMKNIAAIYFTKPNIESRYVLPACDSYMSDPNYKVESPYSAVLYDIPCDCPFLNISDKTLYTEEFHVNTSNESNNDNSKTIKSPYLPSDIDTKLFEGSANAEKDLQAMIGLDSVKDQIEKLKSRIKFYGSQNNGNHMAFLGSAGTGKTTVARIITKILFDLGFIKKNQYIEVSGDYICAGDTNRALAIMEYAYDRVLFIDEAYLMYTKNNIIGVLLKAMEDHRSDFVCILAGYEEQMTKLFASNEGFNSRIKHKIYFPDYTEQEMLEIFNYFISNYSGKSYKLAEEAIPTILNAFTLEKKSKSFGNARTVRNAVDTIMDYYADRSINSHTDTHIITNEDIENYFDNRKKNLQHEFKNASAADQVDEQIIRLSELKPKVKEGSENPEADLQEMVGLDSIQSELTALKNQKEFYNETPIQKILLLGESGCGKSTITKILTGYLYKLGYIEENKYLDISAELLQGSFVGHTAKRAQAIISYATGGVLYIRNYNVLANADTTFAAEAMNILNEAINTGNITIIVADEPSDALNNIKNSFTIVYNFPKYTVNDLYIIYVKNINKNGFYITDEASDLVYNYIVNNPNLTIQTILKSVQHTIKQHINHFDGIEEHKFLITNNDLVL